MKDFERKPPSERYVFRAHNNLSFNSPSLNYETCERQQGWAKGKQTSPPNEIFRRHSGTLAGFPFWVRNNCKRHSQLMSFMQKIFSQVHTIVSWCAENQSEVPPHTSTGCQLTQSLPQLDLQTQLQFNQSFSLQTLFKCLCWYWLLQKYQTADQTSA